MPEPRSLAYTASVGATPIVGFGIAPGVSAGASFEHMLRLGSFSADVALNVTGAQMLEGDAAVQTWRGGGSLGLCGHLGPFYLCGLAGLAGLSGVTSPRIKLIEERNPVSGLMGLRPGVEWRIAEHFAFRAYAEINAALGRPSVWLDGAQYWAAPPVSAIIGVGFFIPWNFMIEPPATFAARAGLPRPQGGAPDHRTNISWKTW